MNYHYRGVKLRQSRSPRDSTKEAGTGLDEGSRHGTRRREPTRDTTKGAGRGLDEGRRSGGVRGLLEGVVEDGGVEVDGTVGEEVVHGTGLDEVGGSAGEDLAVGGDEP